MSGRDLSRAIAAAVRAPIAGAVAGEAGRLARQVAAGAPQAGTATIHQPGGSMVTLMGPGLFAREFGALDSAADPVVAPAIRRLRRRLA